MAIRAKIASSSGRGGETLDAASTLPPNKAIVLFDFVAQEPTDLALTKYDLRVQARCRLIPLQALILLIRKVCLSMVRGAVVVLTETAGEWWHGHLIGTPHVVGMFPATYVARGTGASHGAHSTQSSPPVATRRHQQETLRIAKGTKGFGMGIEDDGTVSEFTFFVNNPARSAGVKIGTRIVAVAGVATPEKAAIIAELQRRAHQTSVDFTFEDSVVRAPAAAIALPEPQPEPQPSALVMPPIPSLSAAVAPPVVAAVLSAPSVPSVPNIKAVVRRGWLEKKGGDTHIDLVSNVVHKHRHYSKGGRRSWKPRWFIAYADGELAYFKAGKLRATPLL